MGQPGPAWGVSMVLAKQNIPILNGDFVLPKIQDANIQKTLADLSPEPPSEEDRMCTICGQHYFDKTAFNAHIRAHLKEKLYSRLGKTKPATTTSSDTSQTVKRKLDQNSDYQPVKTKIKLEPQVKQEMNVMPTLVVKTEPDPLAISNLPVSNCPFSQEMEMNRVELNNDLSTILDQIEKDFEGPNMHNVAGLETPPESESEPDLLKFLSNNESVPSCQDSSLSTCQNTATSTQDVGTSCQDMTRSCHDSVTSYHDNQDNVTSPDHDYLVGRQSTPPSSPPTPLSLQKFASLPAKAIAVLNQLPGKLVLQKSGPDSKVVNVFKVEKLGMGQTTSSTLINIECLQDPNKEANMTNAKIIETSKGTDGEKEYKIVLGAEGNRKIGGFPSSKGKQSADCTICGKSITTKNMARHMEKHTGKKKFQCDICQSSFFQKTHLKNHILLHESGEYHKCEECDQKFLRKTDLQKHMRSVHPSNPEKTILSCNMCGLQCEDPVKLELHKTSHIYERKELCGVCGEKFDDKTAMIEHMQKHTSGLEDKSFSCNVCHKTFTQMSDLNIHEKTHGGEADLICLVCSLPFKSQAELNKHQISHYSCHQCSSLFDSEASLQQHRLQSHPVSSSPLGFLSPSCSSLSPDMDYDFFGDESNCSTSYESNNSPTLDMFSSPLGSSSPTEQFGSIGSNSPTGQFGSIGSSSPTEQFGSILSDLDSDPMSDPKPFPRSFQDSYMDNLTLADISDSGFFDTSHQLDDDLCKVVYDDLYSADLFSTA